MKAWVRLSRIGVLGVLGVAYSLVSYRAEASGRPGVVGLVCAFVPALLALLGLAWGRRRRALALGAWVLTVALLWHFRAIFFDHYSWAYLMQHAGSMALLAWVFGRTLDAGRQPMITQFSMLVHGPLTPLLTSYTRWVTVAWSLFFGIMALASVALFVGAPIGVWSVFANMLTAPLVGLMFLGEYLVRRQVLPPPECPGLDDTIRACYRHLLGQRPIVPPADQPPGPCGAP